MKHIIKIFFIGLSAALLYIGISGTTKKIIAEVKISDFKKSTTLDERKSTDKTKYHYVSRETDKKYGYKALQRLEPLDVLINFESSVDTMFIHEVLSFFIGGHASVYGYEYIDSDYSISTSDVIETSYDEQITSVDATSVNFWDSNSYTKQFVVVRFDLTEEEKRICFNEAVSLLDDPYNLSFVFNTTYYHYCSDLMTKIFNAANINLNPDGFVTSLYDVLTSPRARIVTLKQYDKASGITNYYFGE